MAGLRGQTSACNSSLCHIPSDLLYSLKEVENNSQRMWGFFFLNYNPAGTGKCVVGSTLGKWGLGWIITTKFQWSDGEKTMNWKKCVGEEQRSAFTMRLQFSVKDQVLGYICPLLKKSKPNFFFFLYIFFFFLK